MESSITKLAINLSEGTVQVEGTEEFVRFIYQDFKDSLSKQIIVRPVPVRSVEQTPYQLYLLMRLNRGRIPVPERLRETVMASSNVLLPTSQPSTQNLI